MTFDERARVAAGSVHDDLDSIVIPEPAAVVRRARRRRVTGASVTALVVAVALTTTLALVRHNDASSQKVGVAVTPTSTPSRSSARAVPVGTWSTVDTATSGLSVRSSSFHALISDGSSLLLAGDGLGLEGAVVTSWWSDDGVHWSESAHPTEHDSISAMASHDGTALAIGAPGGTNAFVWRSQDHGRHWDEVARGPVFGAPVPNARAGAVVMGVAWHAGWWIAWGGGAEGHAGIWISRDGGHWRRALDAHTSAFFVRSVAETGDGVLTAYDDGRTEGGPYVSPTSWSTRDPADWGSPHPAPRQPVLLAVNADATVAIDLRQRIGEATAVLRSVDGGGTWTRDTAFTAKFPTALASAVFSVDGLDVVMGTSTDTQRPSVWISGPSDAWIKGPPAQSRPGPNGPLPVRGSLGLGAALGNRLVFMEVSGGLDRFYVFDLAQSPPPNVPLASEQSVPGLAHATALLHDVPLAYGPVRSAEIVRTTRDKVAAIFGTAPQSPTGAIEVLRVVGTFVCNECSTPKGGSAPHGNEVLFLIPFDADKFPAGGGSSFSIGERNTDLSQFGTVYRMPIP